MTARAQLRGQPPRAASVPTSPPEAARDAARLLAFARDHGTTQPSGAVLVPWRDGMLKIADGSAAHKLRHQAAWLATVGRFNLACVPEVLARYHDANGVFGYLMPLYRPFVEAAPAMSPRLGDRVLDALESIWQVRAEGLPPLDPDGYGRRIAGILAAHDAEAAAAFLDSGQRLEWFLGRRSATCVHGDPTMENLAVADDGDLILLDPNPQAAPALCVPELDAAKVLQSMAGWEGFVAGRRAVVAPNEGFREPLCRRFGDDAWPLIVWLLVSHLARTLPYGAKVDHASRLLPSIRAWLDHLSAVLETVG